MAKAKARAVLKFIRETFKVEIDAWQEKALLALIEKATNPSARAASAAVLESFAQFKSIYPRPTGMSKAKDIWIALAPPPMLVDLILKRVVLFKSTTWAGREQATIPHATTFLRQRRWEDEPEQPSRNGRRPDVAGPATPTLTFAAPKPDRLGQHVRKLLDALVMEKLTTLLGTEIAATARTTIMRLPAEREAALAKLAKIEERLLARVIEGLSPEETVACRQEGEETIDRKMAERMTDDAFRKSQRRAFERAVYRRTGLPEAF